MQRTPFKRGRLAPVAAAALTLCALAQTVQAVEIPTGNEDVTLRFDNTIRYSLGYRMQKQDQAIMANPNYDDGDRNFGKGAQVANRFDLLSELDVVVNKSWGARVSTAIWHDGAYDSGFDNTSTATSNTLVNGKPVAGVLSPDTDRFARGPSGELLDAFVFASGELGEMPASIRIGRHTVFWGEGLYGMAALHGVSYGQNSLDLWKGYGTPGVEAKELFRPREQVSGQISPTSTLTLAAQVFAAWESARYPESGSFLTVQDALLNGGESLIVGPNQRLLQGAVGKPNKSGDWGVSAKWSPEWLDGQLGFYARRTADIQPQLAVTPAVATLPAATCSALKLTPLAATTCYVNPAAATVPMIQGGLVGEYNAYYGRNIDIFGLSLSKNIAGISVGSELSFRHNMPLASMAVTVLPTGLANAKAGQLTTAELAASDVPGATGSTMHAIVNALGVTSKTALFDTLSWGAELVLNRWLSVSGNTATFKGGDLYRNGMNGTLTPMAAGGAANVDAVTKNFVGLSLNLTPTWFQVLPSVDLSMPMSWAGGLSGVSAVMSGGAAKNGNYSVGVSADVSSRFNYSLRYIGFYGGYSSSATGAMVVPESVLGGLSDRGHLMFTFKTTF